ncbi:hypothetical protein MTR_3g035410 [Medicago truncatula]|uniref:Uncharacterized protein n=1 Tax=Medicago truncatula TaxID=3880 RepID=G7J0Y4_MEDTR|nr:hypothetical protein MTR_3g035410 [Medicago truncatula]
MCWALPESQKNERRQIPFGRLLSEIFVQGQLLKHLKNCGVSSDEELGTVVGKIINGKTLKSMYLIEKVNLHEEDLKIETIQSDLMTDFPLISKEDNHEVLYQFIKAHFKETGEIISYASILDKMGGAPLKVKGKRTKNVEKDDASAPKPKRAKTVKTEGSTALSTLLMKSFRRKEPRSLRFEMLLGKLLFVKKLFRRKDPKEKEIIRKLPRITPEMEQRAKEVAADELAKQKKLVELYRKQRDEKLKAAGFAESGSLDAEKAAEFVTLVAEVEKQTVKEATGLLQEDLTKGKRTSEAAASEYASEAARS